MDKRITVKRAAYFLPFLKTFQSNHQNVSFLFDCNGLIRAEGNIKLINEDAKVPFIELTGGLKIDLKTITAVNGIFLDSYAEC